MTPRAIESARTQLENIQCCADMYEAASGSEAVVLLTEWDEFLRVDWKRLRTLMVRPLIIDGRNLYSQEQVEFQGFEYVAIGRNGCTSVSSLTYATAY
jgi:UDPglucose 6-dehydrogenase